MEDQSKRIAELEAALDERRADAMSWRSRADELELKLAETMALLDMANAPKGPADNEVWLRCFTAFAADCVNSSRYHLGEAAQYADRALVKYRERFPR